MAFAFSAMLMLFTAFLAGAAANQTASGRGWVRGTIMDIGEAVIPNVTISIEGPVTRRLHSDPNGQFQTELPAGVYRIRAEAPGFFLQRRAALRITAGATQVVHLTLDVAPTHTSESDYFRYEFFPLELPDGPEILFRSSERTERDGIIQFTSKYSFYRYAAHASFGAMTVYADTLKFNKTTVTIEAEGNVIVDRGDERCYAPHLVIEFRTGRPSLSFPKGTADRETVLRKILSWPLK